MSLGGVHITIYILYYMYIYIYGFYIYIYIYVYPSFQTSSRVLSAQSDDAVSELRVLAQEEAGRGCDS